MATQSQDRGQRIRAVERKLAAGGVVVFIILGGLLVGVNVIFASLLVVALCTGCLLRPVAERIVARDLNLYSLLDPAPTPDTFSSRLRRLEQEQRFRDRDLEDDGA